MIKYYFVLIKVITADISSAMIAGKTPEVLFNGLNYIFRIFFDRNAMQSL